MNLESDFFCNYYMAYKKKLNLTSEKKQYTIKPKDMLFIFRVVVLLPQNWSSYKTEKVQRLRRAFVVV